MDEFRLCLSVFAIILSPDCLTGLNLSTNCRQESNYVCCEDVFPRINSASGVPITGSKFKTNRYTSAYNVPLLEES